MKRNLLLLFVVATATGACASRNYTHYLIAPKTSRSEVLEEEGDLAQPFHFGSTTVMKVRWNDGNLVTQVELPLLASGQRVVIEHGEAPEQVDTMKAVRVVPPPPSAADKALIEAYRQRGLRVNEEAPEVSLTRARTLMLDAIKTGNYDLALEWCETVLGRYPSQPEFLRAKASVLLLVGEREKAIEVYERAEEIESDPRVRKKLEDLQKNQDAE